MRSPWCSRLPPRPAPWSSLVVIQPNGVRPPFFCIHGIGGNVLCYHDLALHLAPDQPVYGLQAPGLDGSRTGTIRIESMAARYLEEVRGVQVLNNASSLSRSCGVSALTRASRYSIAVNTTLGSNVHTMS